MYARIRRDIITGVIAPGTHLVELALASRYDSSRTPVREALLHLQHDRLVTRQASGMVVRERPPEEILEIYETWIPLEAAAAGAAARRRTVLDIARIRSAHAAMEQDKPADDMTAVEMNRAFHAALWAAGHNDTMVDLLNRLEAQLFRFSGTTLLEPGRWDKAVEEHARILDAVERQDTVQAEQVAREHFERAMTRRLDLLVRGVSSD